LNYDHHYNLFVVFMNFSQIVAKLSDLINSSSLITKPDINPEVIGVEDINEANNNHLSYVEGLKFASFIVTTNACALILPVDEKLQAEASARGIAWISTREPRLVFAKAIALFYKPYQPKPGIHKSAVIDPTAKIGRDVYIGAHAVIEAFVEIGDGVCIYPNVVVYPEAKIGSNTILHANCTIHERTIIGNDCVIYSGAVIGAEGFGYVPTAEGWYKVEQSGITILENNVVVGCNSAIDRPSVGKTKIGRHTIIDNLVQIGHGCQTDFGCALAGQSGMAGGVKLGKRVILAGQSGIANQAVIGDGATLSAKAGAYGDIPAGEIYSGYPAIPHKAYLKSAGIFGRLPEMYQNIKELKKEVNKQ
jgi:UDP-3-O-[3-hydroxymyristoyl] glucosamine N-acyltransferase